ncbi:MAG: hypothetical protein M0T77_03100 [Actinomycetota bacterium]|nr:hypothetical protein [Actinomycetota bacterium]
MTTPPARSRVLLVPDARSGSSAAAPLPLRRYRLARVHVQPRTAPHTLTDSRRP